MIIDRNRPDFSLVTKARAFCSRMGFAGYTTGRNEDRPVLYIKKLYPMKRKRDGVQFGYSVLTQSLGSGIESRFTVFNAVFNRHPITEGDVIYCNAYDRDGQYFTLLDYSVLGGDE